MGKVLNIAGSSTSTTALAVGTSYYVEVGQGVTNTTGHTAEVQTRIIQGIAGKYTGFSAYISANTLSTASITCTTRKNAGAGNQSFTISAGATGRFSDLANSDTVAVGDTFNTSFVVAAGGTGTAILRNMTINFKATSGHGITYSANSGGATATTASTIYEHGIVVNIPSTTPVAMAGTQVKMKVAGTFSYFQSYISANTRTTAGSFRFRVNGANGNQNMTIAGSATGRVSDTANSDTVAVNDLVNYRFTTGTGANTTTFLNSSVSFVATSGNANDNFGGVTSAGVTRAAGASVTPYQAFALQATDTESTLQVPFGFAARTSNFRAYISANTYSGSATFTVRKNGAAANQNISVAAGTTGWVEDSTNVDVFTASDLISIGLEGGTSGSMTYWLTGLTVSQASDGGRSFIIG